MLLIQALEARMLLAAAAGDTLAMPENLGSLSAIRSINGALPQAKPSHYYRLAIGQKGNFNAILTSLAGDADLQLLNSQGRLMNTSAKRGKATERIGRLLGSGVYYVKVTQGTASDLVSYKLTLQADRNWGSVSFDGERHSVGLVFMDNAPRPIKPHKETWIVIHGWLSNPDDGSIHRLQHVLQAGHPERQVLSLDWSAAADDPLVFNAWQWAPSVAEFAAGVLARWGISSANINIAGHSLGGYVTSELAADIPGGVNRIIAMDPATDMEGLFISGTDYAANSQASVAFIGSQYSTTEAAATASESFRVKVGPTSSYDAHSAVVDLVASMIATESGSGSNPVSRLLNLDHLTSSPGPWKLDAYKGGIGLYEPDPTFEGIITGLEVGANWQAKTLVYKDKITGKAVTVR